MTIPNDRRYQIHMNIAVPVDVTDALDVFCKKRKVTKKAVVELALRRYLADEAVRVAEANDAAHVAAHISVRATDTKSGD